MGVASKRTTDCESILIEVRARLALLEKATECGFFHRSLTSLLAPLRQLQYPIPTLDPSKRGRLPRPRFSTISTTSNQVQILSSVWGNLAPSDRLLVTVMGADIKGFVDAPL